MKKYNSIFYMIGEIVPKITGILLLPIFTRYLTPKDYGILSYTTSLMIYIYIFSSLSLNSYVLRNYFEYKNTKERKKMLGNIVTFIFIFNILFLLIGGALLKYGFELFKIKIDFFPYVFLSLISNFIEVFGIIPLVICRLQEKALKFISITIGQSVLQILVSLFLIIIFKQGVLGRYLGILTTNLIFLNIYIYILRKEIIININILEIKKALKFSLPLVPGAISFALLDVSDRIILEKFVSLDKMGIYSIAYTLGFGVNVIINGGYRAFEPILFKNIREKNFMEIFENIKNKYIFFIFSSSLGFILFSQEILVFMTTKNFYIAYKIIPIIVIGAILKGIYILYGVLIMAQNSTKLLSYAVIIGAITNIIINILYIPKYGIIIAAISTAIGYAFMTVIIHFNCVRLYKLKISKEIKEYFILMLFVIISYLLFYKLKISINILNLFYKILILFFVIFVLKKFYQISFKSLVREFKNAK
jgi:O-antigen/teichoic acid export membrane protein